MQRAGYLVGVAAEPRRQHRKEGTKMEFLLWVIAVVLVIAGIVALLRREIVWGAVLIIVGLLVGPGGVSAFT